MEKKEAMKILKDFHDKSALFSVRDALDTIIPELKESEDEQHRKWILECLYDGLRKSDEQFKGQFKSAIAWLEKQGGQKSVDKVEPKFKVKYAGCEYNVLEIRDFYGITYYGIEDEPNHFDYVEASNCEIISGGYSIKENGSPYPTKPAWSKAKDGDVLAYGEVVFVFKMIYGIWLKCHCSVHKDGSFNADSYDLLTNKYFDEVKPATKEQRDFLFQKMRESGYKLDKDFNLIKI